MFPGFNKKKRSSIGGDFDGDGVMNRKDCQPMNWKKQGDVHEFGAKKYYGKKYNQLTDKEKEFIQTNIAILKEQEAIYG